MRLASSTAPNSTSLIRLLHFLDFFLNQDDCGLLVCQNEVTLTRAAQCLREYRIIKAESCIQIVKLLARNHAVSHIIEAPISAELYDLISQYHCSPGSVFYQTSARGEKGHCEFDVEEARLLFLCTAVSLQQIETRFALRGKMGMVEFL